MLLAFGCGGGSGGSGGPGPFEAGDDPGRGTGTLRVEARIESEPDRGETSVDDDAMRTRFEVDVRDASGARVGGARVVVDSVFGQVTLREGGCGRDYCGEQSGYAPAYALEVERGADYVEGVRIQSPPWHRVTQPDAGANVPGDEPLRVVWSPTGADRAHVETHEYRIELDGDPGSHEIPVGGLRSRDDRLEEERIRVRRERRLGISGVLESGTIVVSVRNGIELTVSPVPNSR
ncbi:MAG: hypothetical protein NZ898_08840 [Myxococcota bacterium]|nr:hypothetical protein [Myxococcota bacterium]MDW8360897.1 hypothetical protein [Myxococcales bacterium]